MKKILMLCLLTLSTTAASAQTMDDRAAIPMAIKRTPSSALLKDTNLRSDQNANLRSDVRPLAPVTASDFATIAPAAGGRESSVFLRDTNLRSDQDANLRSDTADAPRF